MHPYLTKLGIRPKVQAFFLPHYSSDASGNLIFSYGAAVETYGMAFHYVPNTENFWLAGTGNLHLARQVFVTASAMEAIAWFHIHYAALSQTDGLLFLSTGATLCPEHFRKLHANKKGKKFCLLFGNDLLGKIYDLKAAALLCNQPVAVSIAGETVKVDFRSKTYSFAFDNFSLNAFEKQSGYRFNVRTSKPIHDNSWLDLLKAGAFKHL
ncbi:MAG TPA: hypothetical protein VGI43_16035 [Mucilaginibacter sp.]|jgi:hypothetical protein